MNLEECKRIIKDFIMYCRFDEKRKYNDKQLFKAMEYIAFNDFISINKIEDKKKYYENLKQQINDEQYNYTDFTDGKIEVLKELLEEK